MEKVFKNKKTGEIAYYKDGILKVDNCAVEIGHEPSLEFWDLVEQGEVIGKDFYGNDIFKHTKVYAALDDNEIVVFVSKDLAEKYKKEREETILTTNDGVNLKFGDKYFVIDASRFNIFEASAGITFKTERWKGCGFSTRELAEEWILMNKPLLSLEDFIVAWDYEEGRDDCINFPVFKRCKELAEKKLKNE
jgi:hypothetical protein